MTDAVPRKPRNTLLSAYYGLQPASDQGASPKSDPSPTSPPIPSDREQALQHATRLTQTLPLSDLLQRCTQLRLSSDKLQNSLHSSTRRYFQHLDATSVAARACAAQAESLHPTTDAVAECATYAKGINERLEAARSQVDKLEGARRATLLQSAAHRLAAALPPAYRELADLCTDPSAARDRLFLAAQRAAVVLPAVEKLAPHSEEFDRAATTLRTAMETVRGELASRGEADDPYGLAVPDAMHLRRLLGDAPEALIDTFCSTFARQLSADTPSEAACAAAGPVALAQARLHVSFATDRIVPKAFAAGDKFAGIFVTKPDDTDAWRTFVVWLSDVLDDAIAARARRALRNDDSGKLGEPDDVKGYFSAIDGLVAASTAAAAQRVAGDSDVSLKSAAAHVDQVVQALGTGLRSAVRDALAANTADAWQAAVHDFLSGARGPDAADDILHAVREGCNRGSVQDESGVTQSEIELLHDVARYATKDSGLGKGIVTSVRVGMLLHEVGKRFRGGAGSELKEMGSRVFVSIREDVLERIHGVLQRRLHIVRRLGSGTPDTYTGGSIAEVMELLREAGRVGEELSVDTLRCRERDDELLGGDESLVSGVAKMWIEMVRESSIATEVGVQALQMDACEIGASVGREDAFDDVGRAGRERCADQGARLLSKEQAQVACKQRTAARS